MIVVAVPKEYWKHLGIVCHSSSHSGHDIKGDRRTSNTSVHTLNTRDTVERETSNLYARSRFGQFDEDHNKLLEKRKCLCPPGHIG